jgi:8-oxo-dGTP diphosphatase
MAILETGGCETWTALFVRRKRDGLWMFPKGASAREKAIKIACREIKEALPKLKLGRLGFGRKLKPRTVVRAGK